jgi:hypothetical protein
MTNIIVTCITSSAIDMHATGLKADAEIESALSSSNTTKGTMTIMSPTTINLTSNILPKEDTSQGALRLIPET